MKKETNFEKTNMYLESEKIEKEVMNILINSSLDYWEVLGMLSHMKMEIHKMINQEVSLFEENKRKFEDEIP